MEEITIQDLIDKIEQIEVFAKENHETNLKIKFRIGGGSSNIFKYRATIHNNDKYMLILTTETLRDLFNQLVGFGAMLAYVDHL